MHCNTDRQARTGQALPDLTAKNSQCLDQRTLAGMMLEGQLSSSLLATVTAPQSI